MCCCKKSSQRDASSCAFQFLVGLFGCASALDLRWLFFTVNFHVSLCSAHTAIVVLHTATGVVARRDESITFRNRTAACHHNSRHWKWSFAGVARVLQLQEWCLVVSSSVVFASFYFARGLLHRAAMAFYGVWRVRGLEKGERNEVKKG